MKQEPINILFFILKNKILTNDEALIMVRITINGVSDETRNFPGEYHDRYRWIIRWRKARYQCKFPRQVISEYYSRYDKRTGLKSDMNSCLSKLKAAKAQITLARKSREQYIVAQRNRYPLFYDPANDEELRRFDDKIAQKEEKYQVAYSNIQRAVEQNTNP